MTTFVGYQIDATSRDVTAAGKPASVDQIRSAEAGKTSVQAGIWKSPNTAPVGSPAIEKRPTPSIDIGSM